MESRQTDRSLVILSLVTFFLFYDLQSDPFLSSVCLTGSTSSSMSDHWLIRLTGDSKRGSMVSRSSTTCPSSIPDSPESPVFLDNGSKKERGKESPWHLVQSVWFC